MSPLNHGTRETIEQAARSLGRRERTVLVLSAGEGMSTAAIALRIGLTPDQVERLLAKAIAKFDRALARANWPLSGDAD